MALVCDTGPLIAVVDRRDEEHERCAALFRATSEALRVPAPVLVELEYALRHAIGVRAFPAVIDEIARGGLRVEDLTPSDYMRVRELLETYADLRVGFVDAAVMAVTERLGEPKLATLDHRHFTVMRPRHVEALELLPG